MSTEHTLLDHLARCQAAELIRRVQTEPELEYWFRHTLVQEAAYESLTKSARAGLHGRVAQAIEGSTGSSREADAAVLAMHYEAAGMDARALPYAIAAAHRTTSPTIPSSSAVSSLSDAMCRFGTTSTCVGACGLMSSNASTRSFSYTIDPGLSRLMMVMLNMPNIREAVYIFRGPTRLNP